MRRCITLILFLFCLPTLCPTVGYAVCTPGALPFNLQNNTVADATQVMANFNQIVTGTATNCASSGANTDITSLGGLTTPLSQLYGGTWIWGGGTSTGSANAQVVATVTPAAGFSLTQNKCAMFTAGFTNTASPTTLNVFSTGAINVFRQTPSGPQAATGGEIVANSQTLACYDGTQYQLIDTQAQFGGLGPLTTLASGATTDLGSVPSHNVSITGVAAVTSFGGTASTALPFYRLTFTGAATLTYSATCLILPSTANILTAANDTAEVVYLGTGSCGTGGWQVVSYLRATGAPIASTVPLGSFVGLSVKNNAGTPNTQIDYSWSGATLVDQTNLVTVLHRNVSGTINLTTGTVTSTCNGMDGEARGTSAWIYLYAISDGNTACAIGSTTANLLGSGITFPSGNRYIAYMGAMRVNGAGNLLTTVQKGNRAQYVTGTATVPTLVGMASASVATYTALGTGTFIPSTATRITSAVHTVAGGRTALVPNNTGYPFDPASNVSAPLPCFTIMPAGTATTTLCDLELESPNIYYNNTSTTSGFYAFGWQDAVNAN